MQTRDKTDKSRSVAETIGHSHVYSSFSSLHREKYRERREFIRGGEDDDDVSFSLSLSPAQRVCITF